MPQNIFDNDDFFKGYKEIRDNEINANNLFEIPALFSLLPPLTGKRVLDLGTGYGEHCRAYVRMGAARVVGIDISAKMLEVARRQNSDSRIEYIRMPMEDIAALHGPFDVIISSLAIHYVADFPALVARVYDLLPAGGHFVFSQEHPLNTSYNGGERWTLGEDGAKIHLNLADYGLEGRRNIHWLVDDVEQYHRMFSTVINSLIAVGFTIEKVLEPLPTPALAAQYPKFKSMYHMPYFLLVAASKR